MSRAFVKEQDIETFQELPDRPISPHSNDVTPEGMAQIEQAFDASREALAAAQAADDQDAITAAARELRYWSARRATARIARPIGDVTKVRFGSTVTIRRNDDRRQTFRIVGEDEADPPNGTISHVLPLARSLFGKRVGDVVRAGTGEAEIEEVG
ncbi:transcription elongation factor GreA [Rhodopseudomonas palustris]|uniref:GreA/GreB family elongation factor n=1 Tax=Rhodopseudomonas palustris (strain BisB18) TaxID=316056 RepID=Q21A17_RHOPB